MAVGAAADVLAEDSVGAAAAAAAADLFVLFVMMKMPLHWFVLPTNLRVGV